jgi:hypothetical protein
MKCLSQTNLFLGTASMIRRPWQATIVEVALEQNSDITAEAAHAVVLETSLAKVDELIHIGRRMRGSAFKVLWAVWR